MLVLPLAVLAAHTLEVGFCDKNGDGFFRVQPNEQLERWQTPYDNGTHLVIKWKSDRRVSGRNVTSYYVNAATSIPILNLFVGTFGGFPQDICAPGGSKARNAVNVEGSAGTCAPYSHTAHFDQRLTAFEIPSALRTMASWDIVVTVRGYGSHAPLNLPSEATPCEWWCHKYRRKQVLDDTQAEMPSKRRLSTAQRLHGWLSGMKVKIGGGGKRQQQK